MVDVSKILYLTFAYMGCKGVDGCYICFAIQFIDYLSKCKTINRGCFSSLG